MRDFFAGASAWMTGWAFIFRHRSLLVWALIPFMISFAGAVASTWLIWVYYPVWLHSLLGWWLSNLTTTWFNLLYYPLLWIGGFLVLFAILYLVYMVHGILAAPFYAPMAARTLFLKGHVVRPVIGAMFKAALIKTILFLVLGLALFALSFIPVLNGFVIMAALLLLAVDCMDYTFEAQGLGLRQRGEYVRGHKAQWAGLATGLALTLLLPGLTLLVIPGAVVGAALIINDNKDA